MGKALNETLVLLFLALVDTYVSLEKKKIRFILRLLVSNRRLNSLGQVLESTCTISIKQLTAFFYRLCLKKVLKLPTAL